MKDYLINELLAKGFVTYKISDLALHFDIESVRNSELLPSIPWLCLKKEKDEATLFMNKVDFIKCAGESYRGKL